MNAGGGRESAEGIGAGAGGARAVAGDGPGATVAGDATAAVFDACHAEKEEKVSSLRLEHAAFFVRPL